MANNVYGAIGRFIPTVTASPQNSPTGDFPWLSYVPQGDALDAELYRQFQAAYPDYIQHGALPTQGKNVRDPSQIIYDPTYGYISPHSNYEPEKAGFFGKDFLTPLAVFGGLPLAAAALAPAAAGGIGAGAASAPAAESFLAGELASGLTTPAGLGAAGTGIGGAGAGLGLSTGGTGLGLAGSSVPFGEGLFAASLGELGGIGAGAGLSLPPPGSGTILSQAAGSGGGGGADIAPVAASGGGAAAEGTMDLAQLLRNPLFAVGLGTAGNIAGSMIGASATKDASKQQLQAVMAGLDEQRRQAEQARADMAPFREAGAGAVQSLSSLLAGGLPRFGTNDLRSDPLIQASGVQDFSMRPFSMEDLLNDPIYSQGLQFALGEGTKQLMNQASARGSRESGQTLKALTQYATDLANQYGQEAFNRNLQERGIRSDLAGDAYSRFQSEQMDYLNRLAGLAGVGQSSAGQTAAFGTQTGQNIAEALAAGGNARSAGTIGQANMLANSLSAIGQVPTQLLLYDLLARR